MVHFAYGNADFADIRRSKAFYVDKTPFLPLLESPTYGGKHLLFLRPRRFGKSSLLSLMKHYYDASRINEYDELFSGLWIHEHPTPEKNRYLVLHLNFSTVTASTDEAVLQANFLASIRGALNEFVGRHRHRVPALEQFGPEHMSTFVDPAALMHSLLDVHPRSPCDFGMNI